ncbi:AMP-binding protein [Rhodospirillaceae bacterium]|nr:AMP-binding protein [Rhodospirillaceae bacterium]
MSEYFRQANPYQVVTDYPIGNEVWSKFGEMNGDQIRDLQETRFLQLVKKAWSNPFYLRRWSSVGLEPGDIVNLDDITKIPTFSKSDLMESVEKFPPFGDFIGKASWADGQRVVMHTTSGTTGNPQPLFYGPRDREIQNALLARAYLLQGLNHDDIVHSVYGFGMVNGGHYIREAVLHYTNALLLSAGTGLETRSEQQIDLMRRYGATVIVGFCDYITKLADVAKKVGLDPVTDLKIRMISGHLAEDGGAAMAEAWGGVECFDWYGVGDTGIIAAEGPDHDGLYIWEDAHLVEILDSETGKVVGDGEKGNICNTVLFKDTVYPVIRFDTKDVSTVLRGSGGLSLPFRRLAGFQGRSDNMIKLKGINIYPTGIAAILKDVQELNGEYFCQVEKQAGLDVMKVVCETQENNYSEELINHIQMILKQRLGVALEVELTSPGLTAEKTQINARQKPIRLIDLRK